MGYGVYSCSTRSLRAEEEGYHTKTINEIFTQSKSRMVHESMDSKKVTLRECRDSEAHPHSVPIILGLDVTGSMHDIPKHLIADGLPTMMSSLIQAGVDDASLLFLAVGDHECDRYPLQVGQFESGDAELDMWLTRSYLEGGGGGNLGESYPLAWEFATNRVQTDAWDQRQEKGFLITIGDEPFLKSFPGKAFDEIYGGKSGVQTASAEELYEAACEKFHVFHIHVNHSRRRMDAGWKMLGQNAIEVDDYTQIPAVISELVASHSKSAPQVIEEKEQSYNKEKKEKEVEIPSML